MLDPVFPKFGSTIAFIAHVLDVVGILGFSEFLVSTVCALCYFSDPSFISVFGILERIPYCSPSKGLSTKFLFPSSYPKNSTTMRRIKHGGRTVRPWLGNSQLAREYPSGAQIYCSDMYYFSCSHLLSSSLTLIESMQRFSVSRGVFDSEPTCLTICFSLAATIGADPCTTLLHQADAPATVDCMSRFLLSFRLVIFR